MTIDLLKVRDVLILIVLAEAALGLGKYVWGMY